MSRTKSVLTSAVKTGNIPGLVAIAAGSDTVLHSSAHGRRSILEPHRMTTNTIFRSSSLLKPMMTVAALQLAEAGALDLDDRLEAITDSTTHPGKAPTTRQLLGALANPDTFTDQLPMIWTRLAIESASGRNLGHHLRHSILTPLGMDDSYFSVPTTAWDRVAEVHRGHTCGRVTTVSLSTTGSTRSRRLNPTFYTTAPDSMKLLRALLRRDSTLLSVQGHRQLLHNRTRPSHTKKVLTFHDCLSTHCWINWHTGTAGVLFAQLLDSDKRPLTPLFDSFQQEVHTEQPSRLHRFFEFINPYRAGVIWYP